MKLKNDLPYPDNMLILSKIEPPITEEQEKRLNEILDQQTEKQREAALRYFKDHWTIRKITEECGVSDPAIRQRISVVLIHLHWEREYILTGTKK